MTYVRQLQFWLNRDHMPMTIAAVENAPCQSSLGTTWCEFRFLYYGAAPSRYH